MKTIICYLTLILTSIAPCTSIAEPIPFEITRSDTVSLTDKNNGRTYTIYTRLPENYNKAFSYPIIYMTDAEYAFPTLSGATGGPMAAKKIDNAILVGISWQEGISPKESRFRDYTPTKEKSWTSKTGEANVHLNYILREVIPFVEETYSVDSTKRTYVGNSLGGLFGAYVLLTQPEIFANYVLASPSLWYDDELMLKLASAHKADDLKANVYISVGELETPKTGETINDMVSGATRFHDILKEKKYKSLNLKLNIVSSANHEIAFPTSAIQGLYWLSNNGT
jgi:predicted alpha/beta superfamily hydrolase